MLTKFPAEWRLENMVEEELTADDICRPRRPGHVLFPELRNITSAKSLCNKMKANMSVATTREDSLFKDERPN